MSKKHDFLRDEQSRDLHPEREQVGSPAVVSDSSGTGRSEVDAQEPRQGKVENDHNKMGDQAPTQTNQGRRTPESRHDRETVGPGSHNQVAARKGGAGAGRGPRGAG